MIELSNLLIFVGACLLLALAPGPIMIYLVSRSICQGRAAGVLSLFGATLGVMTHMFAAVIGLSGLFLAAPVAYEILKYAGAAYLLWLAWQELRPNVSSSINLQQLPPDSSRKLFLMGLMTGLLNPKVAMFYLSLFPQFVDPDRGSVFIQSLILGVTQNLIAFTFNLMYVLSAAGMAAWFSRNRLWRAVQRRVMGVVLAALAIRLALEERR